MLDTRRLNYPLSLYLSVIFLFMPMSLCHALVYKATFPGSEVVYFKPDDRSQHKRIELDTGWFQTNMGITISEVTADDVKNAHKDLIRFSGGIELQKDRAELTIHQNVRLVLELISKALNTPGFNKILDDNYKRVDPATEQKLYISIDDPRPEDLTHVMERAAHLADTLVDRHLVTRWRPYLKSIRYINKVVLALVFPRDEDGISSAGINNRSYEITQAFFDEFPENRVTFVDQSSPYTFNMMRHAQDLIGDPSDFIGQLLKFIKQHHLLEAKTNPYFPVEAWSKTEKFIIQLNIEESEAGLESLNKVVETLNNYMKGRKLAYVFQLRRIEHRPTFDKASGLPIQVVFQLSNFIPPNSEIPHVLVSPKDLSLKKTDLLSALNGVSNENIQINKWAPLRLVIRPPYAIKTGLLPRISSYLLAPRAGKRERNLAPSAIEIPMTGNPEVPSTQVEYETIERELTLTEETEETEETKETSPSESQSNIITVVEKHDTPQVTEQGEKNEKVKSDMTLEAENISVTIEGPIANQIIGQIIGQCKSKQTEPSATPQKNTVNPTTTDI